VRILIIRGGAVGDFVLTLPAVALLRKRWPNAHIECLGYPGIAVLGLKRYYFEAVRPIDYRPMAGFFIPGQALDGELRDYIASFQLVVSYIYDPDQIFRKNLLRCGLNDAEEDPTLASQRWNGSPPLLLCEDPRVVDIAATYHFAKPLRKLGFLENEILSPRLHLTEQDLRFAKERKGTSPDRLVAIHPGSGSESKNWPIKKWIELVGRIREVEGLRVLITSGEADQEELRALRREFPGELWIEDALSLDQLAALLAQATLFLGHDSGPGHLAAAVGTPSILIFGKTDPLIWAPRGNHVTVLYVRDNLELLDLEEVWAAIVTKLPLT